jgi:hypothetical protein
MDQVHAYTWFHLRLVHLSVSNVQQIVTAAKPGGCKLPKNYLGLPLRCTAGKLSRMPISAYMVCLSVDQMISLQNTMIVRSFACYRVIPDVTTLVVCFKAQQSMP